MLSRSVDVFDTRLLAYALMPNHFHLLVSTPKGNLSEFMRHFNISYTGSFNRKYNRTGHLYQGRYKAFLIDEKNYLLEVSRYIHLNPLRMQSTKPLEEIRRDLPSDDSTSFPGYLDEKKRKTFVHYKTILEYFGPEVREAVNEYKKFMIEGMGENIPSPLEKGKGTGIIGKADFVQGIKDVLGKDRHGKPSHRELPALRDLDKSITPDELIDRYAQLVKMSREELTTRGKQSTKRAILMEMLYRFCNITQPEIGRLLGGIDYSAVSQARKRLHKKIQDDPECENKWSQIQSELGQMLKCKCQ